MDGIGPGVLQYPEMSSVLLAVLLLCPPAWAGRQPTTPEQREAAAEFVRRDPDFGRRFSRAWEKTINELESTRAHAAFLFGKEKIPVVYVDPGLTLEESMIAMFEGPTGRFLVNRTDLALSALRLSQTGVPSKEVPEVLAWKMLPALAHELRHAIVREELLKAFGSPCGEVFLDDELLAYADTARVAREAVGLHPEYWEESLLLPDLDANSGILIDAWERGPKIMLETVRQTVGTSRASELSPAECLKAGEDWRKESEIELRSLTGGKLPPKGVSDVLRKARKTGELPREDKLRLELDLVDHCERLFRDPRRFEKLRGFYRSKWAAVEELWRAEQRSQ